MVDQQRPGERTGGSDLMTGTSDAQTRQATGQDRAQDAKERAYEKADDMKNRTREQRDELMSRGRDAIGQVRDTAAAEVNRRSSEVAERLDSLVRALRTAADELEGDGQSWLADYTRRAAGQVDRVTGYLHDEEGPAMLGDLEEMARTNPGTFLGTSFAAGVAVGRFLRSSGSSPSGRDRRNGEGYEAWGDRGADLGTQATGGTSSGTSTMSDTHGTQTIPETLRSPATPGSGSGIDDQRNDEHRGGPHGTAY